MSYSFLCPQRSAKNLVNNRCDKFVIQMVGWVDGWTDRWMGRRSEWNYVIYFSLPPCGIVIIVLIIQMRKSWSHWGGIWAIHTIHTDHVLGHNSTGPNCWRTQMSKVTHWTQVPWRAQPFTNYSLTFSFVPPDSLEIYKQDNCLYLTDRKILIQGGELNCPALTASKQSQTSDSLFFHSWCCCPNSWPLEPYLRCLELGGPGLHLGQPLIDEEGEAQSWQPHAHHPSFRLTPFHLL